MNRRHTRHEMRGDSWRRTGGRKKQDGTIGVEGLEWSSKGEGEGKLR